MYFLRDSTCTKISLVKPVPSGIQIFIKFSSTCDDVDDVEDIKDHYRIYRVLFVPGPPSTTISVSAKSFSAAAETLLRSNTPDIGSRKCSILRAQALGPVVHFACVAFITDVVWLRTPTPTPIAFAFNV